MRDVADLNPNEATRGNAYFAAFFARLTFGGLSGIADFKHFALLLEQTSLLTWLVLRENQHAVGSDVDRS